MILSSIPLPFWKARFQVSSDKMSKQFKWTIILVCIKPFHSNNMLVARSIGTYTGDHSDICNMNQSLQHWSLNIWILVTLDVDSDRINDQRIRTYRVLSVNNRFMIIDLATFRVCGRSNLHRGDDSIRSVTTQHQVHIPNWTREGHAACRARLRTSFSFALARHGSQS